MKITKPKSSVEEVPFKSVEIIQGFPELEAKAVALAEQLLSSKNSLRHRREFLEDAQTVRLINTIRHHMNDTLQYCLFEQNDDKLREFVKSTIEDFLEELYHRNGIQDYAVICDNTNNTHSRINQGKMYVDIAFKPVRAANFVYLNGTASGQRE